MGVFEDLHRERITGRLAMFERMIFSGYLTRLYPRENMRCFLSTQGVALKDFTPWPKATTARIANNAPHSRLEQALRGPRLAAFLDAAEATLQAHLRPRPLPCSAGCTRRLAPEP